jgi:hypothetical protein
LFFRAKHLFIAAMNGNFLGGLPRMPNGRTDFLAFANVFGTWPRSTPAEAVAKPPQ